MIIIAITFSEIVKACLRRARPERHKRMEINTSAKREGEKISFSSHDKGRRGEMGFFILAHRADPHLSRSAAKREVFAARDGVAINRKFIKTVSRDSHPVNIVGLLTNSLRFYSRYSVNEEIRCALSRLRVIDTESPPQSWYFLRKAFAHFPWAK